MASWLAYLKSKLLLPSSGEDEDEEYSAISSSMSRQNNQKFERPLQVDVNWQGVWGDDGYEWIEHPEGSETWYWRDQETGQWVRH